MVGMCCCFCVEARNRVPAGGKLGQLKAVGSKFEYGSLQPVKGGGHANEPDRSAAGIAFVKALWALRCKRNTTAPGSRQ
eukprot:scaffold46191_cov15-Tisochrysis_lutea.AAC.2